MRGFGTFLVIVGIVIALFTSIFVGLIFIAVGALLCIAGGPGTRPATICVACGNPVARTSSLCPTCGSHLVPTEGPLVRMLGRTTAGPSRLPDEYKASGLGWVQDAAQRNEPH